MISEPTIQELLAIAASSIKGLDSTADMLRGSDYEAIVGPSAIIWSREAQRDTDLFNATNFATAVGEDLTKLVYKRFGIERRLDANGKGTLYLNRPAGGVAETIWTGTRVSLLGDTGTMYRVTRDIPVSSTDVSVELPIEAMRPGSGVAVNASTPAMKFEDPLQDPTWTVSKIEVADGTSFEDAVEFRVRARRERLAKRVGQASAIDAACRAAGAESVVLFRSDYAGDDYDYGLNYCYVGTLGQVGTPELVKACTLALRSARVGGDCMQVLPLARAELNVSAKVYLYDVPEMFDLTRLERIHYTSLRSYLGNSGRYTYTLDGLRGAIGKLTPEVQRVVITSPTTDNNIVVGSMKNFPNVLTKYTIGQISLQYLNS